MTDITELNEQFAIAGHVEFKEGPGGLVVADVDNNQALAMIALQGAQVVTWKPKGEEPVIWLSKVAKFVTGKSIRGGVPICWPWFGPHASEAGFPGHGYARTVPWEVLETEALADDSTKLVFRLQDSEATRAFWPYNTPVECHLTVGKTLEVELVTRNSNTATISITEALHTYFEVGDVTKVRISGLEGVEYIDKVDSAKHKKQSGAVAINSEVDRVYLNTSGECIIDDPVMERRIHVNKRGSDSTVVWNPWEEKAAKMGDMGEDGYLRMVCVESGNAAENVVEIEPGGEHRLRVSYSVERYS